MPLLASPAVRIAPSSSQASQNVARGAPAKHGPGIGEAISRYGLNPNRLEDLKSGDSKRQEKALPALLDTVLLGNNVHSLDLLIDIARNEGEAGRLAESMVFDLVSDPPDGREWLAAEAAKQVAQARDRPRPHTEPDKLSPDARGGKLLYIAGSQASPSEKAALSKQFSHMDPGPDLWSKSRPISAKALNADLAEKKLGKNFGAATTLEAHQHKPTPDWQFTPIEVEGKWVLVGERGAGGLDEAVIFSPHKLDDYDREVLDNRWFNVKIIDPPTKEDPPGASGVFVHAARARLALDLAHGKDPVRSLESTSKALSRMSNQERESFNATGRRRLHATQLQTPPQAARAIPDPSLSGSSQPDVFGPRLFLHRPSQIARGDDAIDEMDIGDLRPAPPHNGIKPYAISNGAGAPAAPAGSPHRTSNAAAAPSTPPLSKFSMGSQHLAAAMQKKMASMEKDILKQDMEILLNRAFLQGSITDIVKQAQVDDKLGHTAESVLFAAFSKPERKQVPDKIAKDVLAACPLSDEIQPAQLRAPGGKLFYMAGFQEQGPQRGKLSAKFCSALDIKMQDRTKDIWSPDRAIGADEMNAHMRSWKTPSESIRPAQAVGGYKTPALTKDWQASPIDLGDKWVLVLERLPPTGTAKEKETRIFSPGPLSPSDIDTLKSNNLNDPNPVIGKSNIKMANASGVLVNDALKNLAVNPRKLDPVSLLKNYVNALEVKTDEGFATFNRERRHQMMGALIDSKSASSKHS